VLLVRFRFSFFFQAEDGIRDFHVTGVQTCALPIFRIPVLRKVEADLHVELDMPGARDPSGCGLRPGPAPTVELVPSEAYVGCGRSEERRVGKECRYRRWTE